jgi:hypothetical protein
VAGASGSKPTPDRSTRPTAPPPPLADQFTIDVYSRTHEIVDRSSFPADDLVLGELADGDIKAQVVFSGSTLPRGPLTLEWKLDGISAGPKPARLNELVEYNSEPTVGNYEIVLRLNQTVLKTFTFRISPARKTPGNQVRPQ